jgi:hypothetical protein
MSSGSPAIEKRRPVPGFGQFPVVVLKEALATPTFAAFDAFIPAAIAEGVS